MYRLCAAIGFAILIVFPVLVRAAELVRTEDLPPQSTEAYINANGILIGDVWTFHCPAGGSVEFSVDTVSVSGAVDQPLDPVARLYFGSTLIGFGDDEMACAVAPVCGFSCPSTTLNCTSAGLYTGFWNL